MKKLLIIIAYLFLHGDAISQIFNVGLSSNNSNTSGEFDFELNLAINAFNSNLNPNQTVIVNITTLGPINLNTITQPIALTKQGTFKIIYSGLGVFQGLIPAPVLNPAYPRNIYAVGNINNSNLKFVVDNLKFVQNPSANPANPHPMIQCDGINSVTITNTTFLESFNPIIIKENYGVKISNCNMSSTFGGGIGIHYFDEYLNSARQATVLIQNNTISNYNSGILLQPLASQVLLDPNSLTINDFPHNGALQNKDVNTDIKVLGNTIDAYFVGIHQGRIPSDRTTPDGTYQLMIDNNDVKANFYCVAFSAPYRHFKLTNNTLSLKDNPSYWFASILNEGGLSYGYMPIAFSHIVFGVNFTFQSGSGLFNALWFKNQFGFDMIYPNSTNASLIPVNHTNSFNVIPLQNNPFASTPHIHVFGKPKNKINFIKMSYPGRIVVFGGETTNIRECTLNPINNPYIGLAQKISPIIQDSIRYLNANNLLYSTNSTLILGNQGISSPILKGARVQGSLLSVAFDLAGTQITPQNGPFVVEFFKSDITGAITDFIGKQTINTLTGLTYSLTLVVPNTIVLNQGDRIGATVTSIATNGNPTAPLPVGTSEVGYIYSDPPCNNCISDFAPIPGKDYIVSCWTKSEYFALGNGPITAYNDFKIKITFYTALSPAPVILGSPVFIGQDGPMVDEWQKIEGKISVPANATGIKIEFVTVAGYGTFVDDVRFHPVDATMKSYAYDPDNMRLMGELDERNYATFYEYDEEGKLIRVKKETEKGIMTIKESRNSKPTK